MTKHILILIVAIFLFACNQKKENNESFMVTNFKGFPPGVDGCSCYFSDNKKCFDNDEYSFLCNLSDSTAYISINNQKVELKLQSMVGEPNKPNFTKTYVNNLYTVTVIIKSMKQTGEEVSWAEGTLLIETKEQSLTKKIVGECGC